MSDLFQVLHCERLPLRTSYVAVAQYVGRQLRVLPPHTDLVIDFGGVGRPVFDLFQSSGLDPIGVQITAGSKVVQDGPIYNVPKVVLVGGLQALLHSGRLAIHPEIPDAPALVREMQDFRSDYTDTGGVLFSARTGKHDDLLLALGIAVWRAGNPVLNGYGFWEAMRRRAVAAGMVETPRTVLGVDLGQARDPTALAVVRWLPETPEIYEPVQHREPQRGSAEWQRQQQQQGAT